MVDEKWCKRVWSMKNVFVCVKMEWGVKVVDSADCGGSDSEQQNTQQQRKCGQRVWRKEWKLCVCPKEVGKRERRRKRRRRRRYIFSRREQNNS